MLDDGKSGRDPVGGAWKTFLLDAGEPGGNHVGGGPGGNPGGAGWFVLLLDSDGSGGDLVGENPESQSFKTFWRLKKTF